MKKSPRKGFTIIELILILAIMAVLATIASGMFFEYLEQGRDSARRQAVPTAANALASAFSAGDITDYVYVDGASLRTGLTTYSTSYVMQESTEAHCYIYGHANGGQDFFIAVESEIEPGVFFLDGTTDGRSVNHPLNPDRLTGISSTDSCATDLNLTVTPGVIEGFLNNAYTVFLLN